MAQSVFINLPVKDIPRSRAFYEGLGFTINEQFSDHTAASVVISEHIYLMVLSHAKFAEFSPHPIGDASQTTAALIALSRDSREAVDAIIKAAVAHGGRDNGKDQDIDGFMYSRSFSDPDGHVFEPMWMNPAAIAG
jgi:predicted lactoylglutathione lyase